MRKLIRWIPIFVVAGLLFVLHGALTATAEDSTWRGEYFNNMTLSGSPVLVRQDREINFEWGSGSPAAQVPADRFSVRWTRMLYFQGGRYRFTTWGDDGVRLYVNGRLVLDRWYDQQAVPIAVDVDVPAGDLTVVMEYYENMGGATARLHWAPTQGGPPQAGEWRGEYFNNPNLSGNPVLTRGDRNLDFNWGGGAPAAGVNADRFSVRWTNTISFTPGRYRFTTTSDDGIRLFINNNRVIEAWYDQASGVHTADVDLFGGNVNLRVEYYENLGGAVARLGWQRIGDVSTQAGWYGEYFNNTTLSGNPAVTRYDADINFRWREGAPVGGIQTDNFSVRWARSLYLEAGRYRFTGRVDDGLRVIVNNQLVIDGWTDQAEREYNGTIDIPANGNYPVRVEYYERWGTATVIVNWQKIGGGTTPPPSGSYTGQYFNNRTLSGSPVMTRADEAINFNWGGGSPDVVVPVDNFSVRWTRTLNFAAGRYRFTVSSDDGVRVWVNNQLIIDKWFDQAAQTHMGEIDLPNGNIPIRVEYYENGGNAQISFTYTLVGGGTTPPPGQFQNWRGEYFSNRNLSGNPTLQRDDANIDFNWAYNAPAAGLPADNFSVRWTQSVYFPAGRYRFTVRVDDGVRLYVNNRLVIDQWYDHNGESSVDLDLSGGQVPIRMEYYENGYWAEARLKWQQILFPWNEDGS